jgi:hypothetical protein
VSFILKIREIGNEHKFGILGLLWSVFEICSFTLVYIRTVSCSSVQIIGSCVLVFCIT